MISGNRVPFRGAGGSRAAQREFRGHYLDPRDGGGNFGLDHQAQPAGDGGFDDERFPGPGGTKDFHSPERGELQSRQGRIGGVFLRHHPGHLCAGFNQEHAGQDWLAGQMAT